MTQAQVIALIQQWIVANGNNEITANVLRPILEAMVNQPNNLIGDLAELETIDNDTLVDAINSLLSQNILNRTALRFVSLIGIDTEQDELYYVKQAINQNVIDNGQPYTCEPGEQMVFYTINIVGVDGDGNFLTQTRYYRLLSGLTSVTSLPLITRIRYLMPDGDSQISILDPDSEIVVNLGNIGATAVHTAFNSDASEPFEMNNDMFIVAQTSSGDKVWKWIGGVGSFGASATPAVPGDFVDLTEQPVVAGGGNFLQAQPLTGSTHTLEVNDINRTTTFINAVTVTIPNSVFIDETATRQQALLSFKDDWTINYPTTDGSDTLSGGAGALVYVERRNISNEWIVKRVDASGFITQSITDGNTTQSPSSDAVFDRLLLGMSNISERNVHTVLPDDGLIRWTSQTGALKIKMPVNGNYTSNIRIRLEIAVNANPYNLHILDLYARPNGATAWVDTSRNRNKILSTNGTNYSVRYGNDGTSPCIWIGELAGQFSTAAVFFRIVYVSYSEGTTTAVNMDFIRTGWVLSRVTSFGTVVATQTTSGWAAAPTTLQEAYDAEVPDLETDPDTLLAVKDDEVVQYDIDNINKYIIPTLTDSNEITFDRLRVFGELSDPRTGTLTDDLTGGLQGIVQKIYLDEDDIPAGWILIGGELDDSDVNIIFCELNSEGDVEYWVTQEQ
jgi:hypothetical protein